ncbi:MAG: serine phosphatase RsbU (regulator of sigma subunit) [Crocinitomicaceae bacterium]|jgi:serine phosphatase RsbU (regulator of sigma subunit)
MNNQDIDSRNKTAWELRMHDLREAYDVAANLLQVSELQNYSEGIADSCKTLGYCYWRFSDYSLSLSHSLRALKTYERLGNKGGEADTLNNVGAVYMFQEDHVKRLEVNLKCKQIRTEIRDLEGVASSEGNIGETYLAMDDYENAEACFQNVLSNSNASPQGRAWALHNLGQVRKITQKLPEALKFMQQALDLSLSVGYHILIIDTYLEITNLFIIMERLLDGVEYAERALNVSRKVGAKDGEKKALYYLSKIYEKMGKFEASLRYHKDYHTIDIEISRDTEIERLKAAQLRTAFDKIEEQKNELIDSIKYAERIQRAVLTRDQHHTLISEFFTFFQPKDIVSGDFYWYYERENWFYICVADCTGHGVPGAFLTMLGTTFLSEIMAINQDISPASILEDLRLRFTMALSQSSLEASKDGMDISLIRVDTISRKAEWAGAYSPLWIMRDRQTIASSKGSVDQFKIDDDNEWALLEIKGDKQPISFTEEPRPFTNHEIQLEKKDRIYLFSDGFRDQFGGRDGKKYMTKNFRKFLLRVQRTKLIEQQELFESEFRTWKGSNEQVDDVCVLGLEI